MNEGKIKMKMNEGKLWRREAPQKPAVGQPVLLDPQNLTILRLKMTSKLPDFGASKSEILGLAPAIFFCPKSQIFRPSRKIWILTPKDGRREAQNLRF